MITRETLLNEQMVDALREVLDLEPLYHARKQNDLWDSMPFRDGNFRTQVTTRPNGPRPVPAIPNPEHRADHLRDIARASGVDRFMHRGRW